MIEIIVGSILLSFIFIKYCCKDKKTTSILLMGIEITIIGVFFLIFSSKEFSGGSGIVLFYIGFIGFVSGIFISIVGFRRSE